MEEVLLDAQGKALQLASKPEKFLQVQQDVFEAAKVVTKVIYDAVKVWAFYQSTENNLFIDSALPGLMVP